MELAQNIVIESSIPDDLKSVVDSLLDMHNVVGYHLPFSPTKYTVEIYRNQSDSTGNSISMVSQYNVSAKDGCCIPLCCLYPRCKKTKEVTDHFHVDNESWTMELISTSAFGGLINPVEKGKRFAVVRVIEPYLIMIQIEAGKHTEVFILSPNKNPVSSDNQIRINEEVHRVINYKLPIHYL